MADASNPFTKMVPGFDFLQNLVKNAGAALPAVGQWIAPTLDPEELEKRISDLRTVQFWLEQNARMLGATIQALEVQRMTLSTLKTMNVQMGDLTESLKIRMPAMPAMPAMPDSPDSPEPAKAAIWPPAPPASAPEAPAAEPTRAARPATASKGRGKAAASSTPAAGVVDPMQWWGALTKQFTELAANAMKDTATDAAKNLAGAMVKQGVGAASQTLKAAAGVPMGMAQAAALAAQRRAGAAGKPAKSGARSAAATGRKTGKAAAK